MDQQEMVMDQGVLENIKTFTESMNLKKTTLTFIASRIPEA